MVKNMKKHDNMKQQLVLMKKTPLVSVVIPAYNEARYISQCIESLLNQTYSSLEIVIVDDGSQDNTVAIIEEYVNNPDFKYPVKILKQKNSGPGAARNLGAKKARGEILILVDADMVFDKNYIKELIKPIISGKEIGTFHKQELVRNITNIWARCWSLNRMPKHIDRSNIFRAIKREVFLSSGGFNPNRGYFDDDLGSILGKQAKGVQKAVCYHNNPETLLEVFSHSQWVGASFIQDIKTLVGYIKNFKKYFVIGLISFVGFVIILQYFLNSIAVSIFLPLILVSIFFMFFLTLKKIIKEKYVLYILFMPVFLVFRIAGLISGALQQTIKSLRKK